MGVDSGTDLGNNEPNAQEAKEDDMSTHPSEPKAASRTLRTTVKISSPTASQRRVLVAAARLRVTLDERLGRPTPSKAKALAKEAQRPNTALTRPKV